MWKRYSERARQAVASAEAEAMSLGHEEMTPDHLLLGLLSAPNSMASRVLQALAVEAEEIRQALRSRLPARVGETPEEIRYSPAARSMVDAAYEEARDANTNVIGTELLLLGLLLSGNRAGELLAASGVTPDRARAAVVRIRSEPHAAELRLPS
jgi:ATP-dependent Clp protease ATP-binding subunit ClpA